MLQDDPHPLVQELASLRLTAARFQHEAHAAAIKLQHHSLDTSRLHDHAAALEQQNERLVHELNSLRASPDTAHHPAVSQVHELTLALRRVSEKIELTEHTLLERTNELVDADSELVRARHLADGAYELAARMRAREEASKARERELEFKARASEEERKMVDLVVQEYADLVRNLEGRKSSVSHTPSVSNRSASSITLVDNLQDSKSSLHRILTEFSTESEKLHTTIADLNAQIVLLQTTLDAERKAASHDRALLAQTKVELDKLNLEDQTAAKMVSRYMKFSQASTNALQEQITTLKTRHTATTATLDFQLSITESQLASEHAHSTRLQDALDELCDDLACETYGRRREVALRLALIAREEGIAEFMRRWVRRARESYERCYPDAPEPPTPKSSLEGGVQEVFHRMVSDAESLLVALDDEVQFTDATRASGSLARIALSREAVEMLRSELQEEVQKRVEAVRSALIVPNGHIDESPTALSPNGSISLHDDDEMLPVTPSNGDAALEQESLEAPHLEDASSPLSIISPPQESVGDPFIVAPPVVEITEPAREADTTQSSTDTPLPLVQQDIPSIPTLLVHEELKADEQPSPAVSMLDLTQEHSQTGVPPPDTDTAPHPQDEPSTTQHIQIQTETPVVPTISDSLTQLISDLEGTKHRYDDLQHALRDCSLALKDLKRTLPTPTSTPTPISSLAPGPSPHAQAQLRLHLASALTRLDDYLEDARVELEIRIADEELTARGFQTLLRVPGAPSHERAEVVGEAKRFVDGRDESVRRARERFVAKVGDVGHDVAVLKRIGHGAEVGEEVGAGAEEGVDADGDADGEGGGWSAWTAGLLGGNVGRPRSPGPTQTFGTVMTSPRLRHMPSLKTLHGESSQVGDGGPLVGLGLRIAGPPLEPSSGLLSVSSPGRYPGLGVGAPGEGGVRPRTMSAMYAVGMGMGIGGRRSSSVGLGVGRRGRGSGSVGGGAVGGSPLRGAFGNGSANGSAGGNGHVSEGVGKEVYDLSGDVE